MASLPLDMPVGSLRLRSGLIVSRQGTAEKSTFVVKDPANGRFFRFREVEHFIAQQLDGAISLDELQRRVEEKFDGGVSKETLERFIERLSSLGLLTDARTADQPHSGRRIAGDLFYLRFKAFDPDRLFTWLVGKLPFLFTPAFVVSSAALIIFALGLTVSNWPEIRQQFFSLFHFESLLLAWVIMLLVITLHEFAHGMTCKYFGGQVHELGFMLIYFQPAFYCNVSDAWLFPEKSRRLWVTFAGAYFEMFLWALSTVVWRVTEPATTINHLALVVTATSAIKSLFNLNPLIKLDGYYLLCDYLDVPNLRQKAFQYLGACIKRPFGATAGWMQSVSPRERGIYFVYGLLAASYTYWILGLVVISVGAYLVGRYEAWGFAVFATLLFGLVRHPIRRSLSRARAAANGSEGKLPFVKKLLKTMVCLGVVAAILYFWPMQLRVAGEFTILPIHNADVRAEVEGIIQEILHDEGDVVSKGEVLVRLSERDIRADLHKLAAESAEKQAKLKMLRIGARPEEIVLAKTEVMKAEQRLKYTQSRLEIDGGLFKSSLLSRRELEITEEEGAVRQKELDAARDHLNLLLAGSRPEEIEALEAELNRLGAQQHYLEEQLKLLTVASPVSGIVTTRKLKERLGERVEKGALIAKVHEMNTVTAEIAVPEKDISDVKVGQKVILKARAHPQTSFEGTVTSIAPIATPPDEWRQQRTVVVVTRLENPALLLRPEMSGRAKISCGQQRALTLLGRRFMRYLRVEFWSWW